MILTTLLLACGAFYLGLRTVEVAAPRVVRDDEAGAASSVGDTNLVVAGASLGLAVGALALPPLALASGGLSLALCVPLTQRTWRSLVHERRVRSSLVDLLGVGSSILVQCYVLAGLGLVVIFGGEKLQRLAATRDRPRGVGDLPGTAWLRLGDAEIEVAVDALRGGDVVVVGAGEWIPADGVVLAGVAWIDDPQWPGASRRMRRGPGERVFAATRVLDGCLHVEVRRGADAPTSPRFAAEAPAERPRGERLADAAVVPALGLASVAGVVGGGQTMVAAFNCNYIDNMRLAVPAAVLRHRHEARQRGLVVRDEAALERLAAVDTLVLDAALLAEHPEAAAVIPALRRHGLTICVVAGESVEATPALDPGLAADLWYVASPDERPALFARLRAAGRRACFVGAGLADVPGLRGADAAIAVRGTPAAATDVAHVVLMGGDLRALPGLFVLVRRHADNLRRGLWINGAGTVAGVVGVLLLGLGTAGAAVLYSATVLLSLANAGLPPLRRGRA